MLPDEDFIVIRELTFSGHEFLNTVRDEKVWAAVKSGSKSVGSARLETLMAIGKGLIKKKIEDHTGIKL